MPEVVSRAGEGDPRVFATTHWTVVMAAADSAREGSNEALSELCRTYWYPLYAFARRQGQSPECAQDLTQGFFAHLLAKDALLTVDRARGRFRAFLLASFRHFLLNERERSSARKRGGGAAMFSLDHQCAESRYGLEIADRARPDVLFDRNWAWTLMEHVLGRLEEEQAAQGGGALFELLRPSLTDDPDAPGYTLLASRTGRSESALRMTIHRLRLRYRELLREELARTVSSAAQIEEEFQHLRAALQV